MLGKVRSSEQHLFDEKGLLAIDPLTHQALKVPDVFIGGDVRKVGFMVDAMAEGRQAAYAIDQHLSGSLVQRWVIRYEGSVAPVKAMYKTEPAAKWTSPDTRISSTCLELASPSMRPLRRHGGVWTAALYIL